MPKIPYLLVDAFTEVKGGGNRVALVLDARGMTSDEMHWVASKLYQSQAAFVTDWDASGYSIRFFAANGELEFSGHAAVAVAVALQQQGLISPQLKRIYLKTITESLTVELEHDRIRVQSPAPRFRDPPQWKTMQEFADALGANERYLHRGLPYGIASTGLWALFIPVVAPGLIDDLEPEMERISELSSQNNVAAVHVFAPYSPRRFYARTFAPALGIPEDPVTGSANAALGALLARAGVVPRWEGEVSLTVTQGHRMGGPGEVEVKVVYEPSGAIIAAFIGGKATISERGELEF